jgi:hypothetical protein
MAPRPKYGEIAVAGSKWRWTTVGHFQGSPKPTEHPARFKWSVCFRSVEDPDRYVWRDLAARENEELTEGFLRRLLEEARSEVEGDLPWTG